MPLTATASCARHRGGPRPPALAHDPPAGVSRVGSGVRRPAIAALISSITPSSPFAFDLALRYLQTSPSAVTEVIDGGAYHRAVRLLGRPAVLKVNLTPPPPPLAGEEGMHGAADERRELPSRGLLSPARGGAGGEVALRVAVLGDGLGPEHLAAGVELARRVFCADAEIASLEGDVAADPIFAAVAARFHGLRPVLLADPVETLVWAILGQQINVRFAAKLKRALVERYGERVAAGGRDYLLFPRPETLAGLDHDRDLRALQFSRQKSEYTILVGREIAAGRLDLEALRSAPADEALARLTALKGVGRWTAEYMLLRGFGHADVIPAGDGGLRRAIGDAYGFGRLASEAEVRATAERWAPWRGYAAFYWWFTLQLEREHHAGAGHRVEASVTR